MIDWSKLGWNEKELDGVETIRLSLRKVPGEMIAVEAQWVDRDGNITRQDTHIEMLKPIDLTAATGE